VLVVVMGWAATSFPLQAPEEGEEWGGRAQIVVAAGAGRGDKGK